MQQFDPLSPTHIHRSHKLGVYYLCDIRYYKNIEIDSPQTVYISYFLRNFKQ